MARAVKQHKTKSAKRKSRRRTSQQSGRGALPPYCQAIDDVFFRRWRDLFGSERALQHLEDTLRSRPFWHVSARGKVTRGDPGFWQRATLSEETDADGVDRLAVRHTPYVHDPDYSQYGDGHFVLRTTDIVECEERLTSGNNVTSDYSPIARFEEEEGLRPPRLAPTAPSAAPLNKKLPSTSAPKKKRRKAKRPSRADAPKESPSPPTAPDQQPEATAGLDLSKVDEQVSSKEWIIAECKRLKKAGELPANLYRQKTDLAKLLEDRLPDSRKVGYRYIRNMLSKWRCWPIQSIEIS